MTKEKLIEIIQRLLRTEADNVDLSFLAKLSMCTEGYFHQLSADDTNFSADNPRELRRPGIDHQKKGNINSPILITSANTITFYRSV